MDRLKVIVLNENVLKVKIRYLNLKLNNNDDNDVVDVLLFLLLQASKLYFSDNQKSAKSV